MLTSRDVEILGWIARMGAVEAGHVMERFCMGRTAGYRRLAALADAGLVERVGLVYGAPSLFLATRDGLALTNTLALGACRVTPATVTHWRWSGWAALTVEREFGPERVLSDREVRSWEREAGERFVSAVVGRLPDGGARPHRPDLAVLGQGRGEVALVVEVELTQKARRRLQAILRGYARNRRIGRVRYYAPPSIARAVDEAARAVHASEVVDVRPLAELEVLDAARAA
jgi:hypothetical protein